MRSFVRTNKTKVYWIQIILFLSSREKKGVVLPLPNLIFKIDYKLAGS